MLCEWPELLVVTNKLTVHHLGNQSIFGDSGSVATTVDHFRQLLKTCSFRWCRFNNETVTRKQKRVRSTRKHSIHNNVTQSRKAVIQSKFVQSRISSITINYLTIISLSRVSERSHNGSFEVEQYEETSLEHVAICYPISLVTPARRPRNSPEDLETLRKNVVHTRQKATAIKTDTVYDCKTLEYCFLELLLSDISRENWMSSVKR